MLRRPGSKPGSGSSCVSKPPEAVRLTKIARGLDRGTLATPMVEATASAAESTTAVEKDEGFDWLATVDVEVAEGPAGSRWERAEPIDKLSAPPPTLLPENRSLILEKKPLCPTPTPELGPEDIGPLAADSPLLPWPVVSLAPDATTRSLSIRLINAPDPIGDKPPSTSPPWSDEGPFDGEDAIPVLGREAPALLSGVRPVLPLPIGVRSP